MKTRLKTAAGALTVVGVLTVGVVGDFEGVRTKAYRDVVGVPTVCFGETRGVKMGDTYTMAECRTMLGDGLVEFEQGIRKCLKNPDAIPDKTYATFISLAWNIGQRGFCGSSVAKQANAGNLLAACDKMLAWNKGGGKVLKGLVNRRKEERAMCIEGVREGTVTIVDRTAPIPQPRPEPVAPKAEAPIAPPPPVVVPPAAEDPGFWSDFFRWLWGAK